MSADVLPYVPASGAMTGPPLTLPHSIEAEQALIGCVLYDNASLHRITPPPPEAFHEPVHGRVWAMILDLSAKGRLADPTLLAPRLADDEAFRSVGGLAYLADLIDKAPPASAAEEYARAVVDHARRRAVIHLGRDAIDGANNPATDPFDTIARTSAAATALLTEAAPDGACLIDARAAAHATVRGLDEEAESGKPRGALTGLRCFDRRMRGLRPGHLVIVAGRPSMGKTGLARAAALGSARRNPSKLVPFFTQEMDREEISERTLSQLSHEAGNPIPYRDMDGDLDGGARAWLDELSGRIPPNLILDDTAVLTVEHVRRQLLALRRRGPIAAAFIDYLQIMARPERQGSNDAAILGKMTSALKQTAREVGCAIVLLSQLSRKVEERDNKRPQLSDLRESGAIEQDANAVLFCYREAYYLERQGPAKGDSDIEHMLRVEECRRVMEVICAKQRRGPIGTDRQRYIAEVDVVEDGEFDG